MRSASSSTSVFSAAEVEAGALQVVHDAARRADHDVGAVLEAGDLRPHGAAAAQGQHLDVVLAASQAADFLRHLVGQLARRTQHQGLHREAARIEPGQQGQGKGRRLAAAGPGLRDQVLAGQRKGQARRLDRRHLPIAELFEVGQRRRCQRQGSERQVGGNCRGGFRDGIHAQL
jgi:hypothetical protein